jgi:hypothetical protein
MFSHVVIFWTDPAKPAAADELVAGAKKYLNQQPGILHFHVGKMAKSPRDVVDQTYQVALNIVFDSKAIRSIRRTSSSSRRSSGQIARGSWSTILSERGPVPP